MLCKDWWGLAWYDGLRGDTVAPVVNNYCSQRVDAFRVDLRVGLHSLQVTALRHKTVHPTHHAICIMQRVQWIHTKGSNFR